MTTRRDPDRQIHAFLLEGDELLNDQVYDAVRAEIERKRQRTFIGPWRRPLMNKLVTYGLGAAAVVVLIFAGSQFFGSVGGTGSQPTSTPEPTATAEPPTGGLPLGPFAWMEGADGTLPVTVTIPAPGWNGEPEWFALEKYGASAVEHEDDASLLVFNGAPAWSVPGDACRAGATLPDTPSATVDEVAAALAAQAPGDASAPVDITVDGHAGKSVTLQVPADIPYTAGTFSTCDREMYCLFLDPEISDVVDACARPLQYPSQFDELWIVEVNDRLVIIDASYNPGTADEHVQEMRTMVESMTFE